jgi:hypothetical protein
LKGPGGVSEPKCTKHTPTHTSPSQSPQIGSGSPVPRRRNN